MSDTTDAASAQAPLHELNGTPYRVRVPQGAGPHPLLIMIHGFQGTEDVTWIFSRAAGPEWLIISPRAPLPAAEGFSWHLFDAEGHTDPESFWAGLHTLRRFIEDVRETYPVDPARIVLLGFSQGGAMAYTYALNYRDQVAGVVSLGGYIPGTIPKPLPSLHSLPILIIHGTQDETIPIAIARKNRDALVAAGATVSFLEEPVGHKVGILGMRELTRWLAELVSASA